MPFVNGQAIDEDDYINESEKNATPASDAGKAVKLEGDGRLGVFFTRNGAIPNAGATINGATLPVPVYQNKTDNEVYACDANDLAALKFLGFAISNGTNGAAIKVQTHGVVSGFTGLAEGEKYYVQDTAGTIGTTPGTYEVMVGIAISETQLLIVRGRRYACGTVTGSTGTPDHTITVGFRPSRIRIHAILNQGPGTVGYSNGGWTKYGQGCVYYGSDGGSDYVSGTSSDVIVAHSGDSNQYTAVIDNVDDTSFRINGSWSSGTVSIFWEAEGEY